MTLAIGTGRTLALGPPRYLNSGRPRSAAAALALASETARMALAPSLDFGFRPVQLEHDAVHRQLIQGIHAAQGGQDFVGDVFDGLGDAFAVIAGFVAVAQFEGFVFAGAGAGRHGRAAGRAAGQE